MPRPRVVFIGNDPWAALTLGGLVRPDGAGLEPVMVITRVPRPAGRGSGRRPTPVADLAQRIGLPLVEVETVRHGDGLDTMRKTAPDVVAVVAYGEILTREVLDIARIGCINVHFSLLPRWRGASPVQRTIWAGDTTTGITTILMDEGLDTGPILEQIPETVTPYDDAGALGARLAGLASIPLSSSIRGLADGSITPHPQPIVGVTYAPKLTSEDRDVDWTQDAEAIGRQVRALSPDPGAITHFRGSALRVARGETFPGVAGPGELRSSGRGVPGIDVGTGRGLFRLLEVVPAGRARMSGADWARGARIEPGEHLV